MIAEMDVVQGSVATVAASGALPADRSPALVYLAGLSAGSRPTQARALVGMAALLSGGAVGAFAFPWHQLRYQHVAALRSTLAAKYAPTTANRWLSALRGVIDEAWRLGLIGGDDRQRVVDVKGVRGSRVMTGRALGADEVEALFRGASARDAALLALLYGCGLRRAEAVGLDLADLDLAEGTLRVLGKGNKERSLPLVNGTLAALNAWVLKRGSFDGPLLLSATGRRLTPQAVLFLVRRRAQVAGVARFSPHDCRRSFVGDLLDSGADLVTVSALAGHSDPKTTSRYDRRGEVARRRAVGGLRVPFGVEG